MKHIRLFEDFEEVSSTVDYIISGLESGELVIVDTNSGYFITDETGEDIEAYTILPYDDDPVNGWYIIGHDKEGGDIEEEISEEDIEKIKKYV